MGIAPQKTGQMVKGFCTKPLKRYEQVVLTLDLSD